MAKINLAVVDAGPFIHLHEVQGLFLLKLYKKILSTPEVLEECERMKDKILQLESFQLKSLDGKGKDFAKSLQLFYELDLGESTAIALCKQEGAVSLLTDDLEARTVAGRLGLQVHGTMGIVLRSFRERVITKKGAIAFIEQLYHASSLFLSKDLKEYILQEIEKFSKK